MSAPSPRHPPRTPESLIGLTRGCQTTPVGAGKAGKIRLMQENICADSFNLFLVQLLKHICFLEIFYCDKWTLN